MHHVPFNQQQSEQVYPSFTEMKRPGIVIGGKSLASEGKWRCKVCTWANDNEFHDVYGDGGVEQ